MIRLISNFYRKISNKKNAFIIWIFLFSFLSSMFIFKDGLADGHDISFHLMRVKAVADNIKIGKILPVYFKYLYGFGYGNGLFYPDIFLYIPAFLYVLGLKLSLSVKIFLFMINFFSIYTMYLCVRKICKNNVSIFCAIFLYSFSTYRLVDSVNRFALGEVLSFIFLPLIILGLYEILYGDIKKSFYFTIGLVGLCFSHVLSLYLMSIFILIIILFCFKKLKERGRLKCLIINGLFSLLITCCFWVPMLEQMCSDKFNFYSHNPLFENVVPIIALFFDYPIVKLFSVWLPSGIGIIYYVYMKNMFVFSKKDRFIFIITLCGFFSILFSFLGVIWKFNLFYKLFSVIQFPWRFYMFATFFLIISFSYMIKYLKSFKFIKIYLIYTFLIFIINNLIFFNMPRISEPYENLQIMAGEYLPSDISVKDLALSDSFLHNYKNDNISYELVDNILNVTVLHSKDNVEVPLFYYKGYRACDDSKCYNLYKTDNGLVGVKVDKQKVKFTIEYVGTELYQKTRLISLMSVVLFVFVFRLEVVKRYEK